MRALNITILIVEDDRTYQKILQKFLEDEEYNLEIVGDGQEAWELLEKDPEKYDIALLDRTLPGLDGMEILKRMKHHPVLENVPVIIESACSDKQEILAGMKAGAHYYLTKPYKKDILCAIMLTAVGDRLKFRRLRDDFKSATKSLALVDKATFYLRDLCDAQHLAEFLSNMSGQPDQVVTGLSELFINSIEHGNLGITYEEKSKLSKEGQWVNEVEHRLNLPENSKKRVKVEVTKNNQEIRIHIKDDGDGFDWRKYMEIDSERIYHQHGRGIAIARLVSFEKLHYNKKGNEVEIIIKAP